jgi:uncharacterized membrane protein YphA (DoxX/SURF4 family)
MPVGSNAQANSGVSQQLGDQKTWGRGTLWAFRFLFAYLMLYMLPFPINFNDAPDGLGIIWVRVVPWVFRHLLHVNITVVPSGAETVYDYARTLLLIVLGGVAAVVWSLADRGRTQYRTLYEWLRLYVRLYLGAVMLSYGATKVLPVQFASPPSPSTLVQPFGDSSPHNLLWNFMASSRVYRVFSGLAEVVGGALLFVPRVTTLGALVCAGVLMNVFMLNISYDFGAKLFSLHLLLMSLFLMVPDLGRLAGLLVLNRRIEAAPSWSFFRRPWLNRAILAFQAAFGVLAMAYCFALAYPYSRENVERAVKTPFYGIWYVDEFTLDGKVQPPFLNNEQRWWRVIFEHSRGMAIQWAGGSVRRFWTKLDRATKLYHLNTGELTYDDRQPENLILDGTLDGHRVHAKLHRKDITFRLTSQQMHFIPDR